MTDLDFWRKTAARFQRLQPAPPSPGEPQRQSHNGICAWWKPDGWDDGKIYHFFNDGDDIEANKNIERLFRIAAESAAVELGHPGGEAGVFAWLDLLRLHGIYVSPGPGTRILHRICDASAEYCVKCETDAKTAARKGRETAASNPDSKPDSLSWQQIRDTFLKGSDEYPFLTACWGHRQNAWTFREFIPDPSLSSVSGVLVARPSIANPGAVELFKATARSAVLLLGEPVDALPPWQVWLDTMRVRQRGFRLKTVSSWEHTRRFLEERTPVPLSSQRVLKDGTIAHVFKEAADLCEDIGVRAVEKASTVMGSATGAIVFHASTWSEVEISFFNEHTVQITVGQNKSIHEFGQLGMAHKRSGKPTLAWQTLHLLAQSNGVISSPATKHEEWRTVEKRMQEARAWLRARFNLLTDPLPFVRNTGYRAEFSINCAASYRK